MLRGWIDFFKSALDYKNTFERVESQGDLAVLYGYATWKKRVDPDYAIWPVIAENDLVAERLLYEDKAENRRRCNLI